MGGLGGASAMEFWVEMGEEGGEAGGSGGSPCDVEGDDEIKGSELLTSR